MYLVDKTGKQVVSYDYDPYGKIIGTNDYSTQTFAQIPTEPENTTKTIADLNPLRYRGYYYDTDDLGFYYLQSRYYDADTCRFISADSYASTGQGFVGFNMYAYCNGNPITGHDPTGEINWKGFWVGVGVVATGAVILAATFFTAGAAAPLAATAITAAGSAAGIATTATGAAITYGAVTEEAIVLDVSFSNGSTHDKTGYSVVMDFHDDNIGIDTYYHYGKTTSGYGVSYGVGFVYNYEKPGDYGGYFADASATYNHNGIDYGLDVCTDPSAPFQKCSAALFTVGVSFPSSQKGKFSVNSGVDYYLPISYSLW